MNLNIIGTGSYLPETIYDNEYFTTIVDTSDEWITTRTGIQQRHIAKDETSVSMATKAAKAALKDAGVLPEQLKAIICATLISDNLTPNMASELLINLGACCQAFDLNAACSGFLYSLKVAEAFVEEGPVLIVACDKLSRIIDYTDRKTCVLFGDSAGAAVVAGGDSIKYIELNAYGDKKRVLNIPGINNNMVGKIEPSFLLMEGTEVFKFATVEIAEIARRAFKRTGIDRNKIKWVVPHQANSRIIDSAAKRLNMDRDKFYTNLERVGNTSAGSIPVALDELVKKSEVQKDDLIMLVGFGGGLSSGVVILEWKK